LLRIVAKEIMFQRTFACAQRRERAMKSSIKGLGAAALGIVVGLTFAVSAQAAHRHVRHPAAEGRQIVVHPRESYLTAGPGAFFGDYNGYALDTLSPPGTYMPEIDHTFSGQRGLDRLPNNFTVPGCCVP
jgi:hypothetical protein